ncbi:MAG: cytochrome c oxidase subunit II [Bacteroidales bacterium]|nr:cytochrome c oxidase subunit II [Bacteroidales bacterium]MCF8405979.1 cytochrome c oxidase subunit II [Bacteroidales bacterium]
MYSSTGIDASNFVGKVDQAFLVIMGISIFFLVGLTSLMIYFIIKYNRKKNAKTTQIEGNLSLELLWTIIPTLLVILMFYYGWAGWKPMKDVPEGAREITSIARMWNFSFVYENGKVSQDLVVPVDEPIVINLEALDVIHSLFIPAFRVKEDMVPGQTKQMWFRPLAIGTYDLFCTEYCGLDHSYMSSNVKVLSVEDFELWYTDTTAVALTESDIPGSEGLQILRSQGCTACHTSDGSRLLGPSYLGIWGTERIVLDGKEEKTVIADEAYIIESIYEPNVLIVKGYPKSLMQSYTGVLSEEEIQKIIDYLKVLNE